MSFVESILRRVRSRGGVARAGVVAVVAVVAGSFLAACGSSSSHASGAGGASGSTVVIKNFGFEPIDLTVAPGATVTVHNEDSTTHTVTADGTHAGAFDTGNVSGGATATFKAPASPGTYTYECHIHQFMHGILTVK